jgi:hypothetical protein
MRAYNLSREGITSRYQILVFPNIDCQDFTSDFLSYFLHNSIFSSQSLSLKISQRHQFPFCLIGFYTGMYSDSLFQYHTENNYVAKYILNPQLLAKEISRAGGFQRAIFMIFDSYIGHGDKILTDVLEIKLIDILQKSVFDKLNNLGLNLNEESKLSSISLNCMKNMEATWKLFADAGALHSLSFNISDFGIFDGALENSFELGVIIIRDVINTLAQQPKQDAPSEITSTNMDAKSILSTTEAGFITRDDVFRKLLELINHKGLEILSIRTAHFGEDNMSDFTSHFERIKLESERPVSIIVAVRGKNTLKSKQSPKNILKIS